MSILLAVSLVVGIAVVLVGVPIWWLWWRAVRTQDVERLALHFKRFLGEVTADGGLDQARYLEDDHRGAENELDPISKGGLHDRKLQDRVATALDAYRKAFASSRPKTARVIAPGEPESPGARERRRERDEARGRQTDAAWRSFDAFDEALARIHKLQRWTVRRS